MLTVDQLAFSLSQGKKGGTVPLPARHPSPSWQPPVVPSTAPALLDARSASRQHLCPEGLGLASLCENPLYHPPCMCLGFLTAVPTM